MFFNSVYEERIALIDLHIEESMIQSQEPGKTLETC